jgi:hypothetical protein
MAGAGPDSVQSPPTDGALRGWLTRVRWRRRGAWLWPLFLVLVVIDAIVGHDLPPQGDSQTLAAAALLGCVLSLLALVLFTRPFGALLRRLRPDLPVVIARDYIGRALVLAVTATLTIAGVVHHSSVVAHHRSMQDAMARAQAWIGDRAPAEFRRNVQFMTAYTIQPGIYRMCVPAQGAGPRNYCVIVKESVPFPGGVSFAGYESNSVFGAGTG